MTKLSLAKKLIIPSGILLSIGTVGSAYAATVISNPVAGGCYEGGTSVYIDWSNSTDLIANHAYVTYDDAGVGPVYPAASNIPGGDTSTTISPLLWTLPTITTPSESISVESQTVLNIETTSSTTGAFGIDSSGPASPSITSSVVSTSSATIRWNTVTDSGCMGLEGYKVFRNGALIATTFNVNYTDSGLSAGTKYTYMVEAYDSFATSFSNSLSVTTASPPKATTPITTRPVTPPSSTTSKPSATGSTTTSTTSKASAPSSTSTSSNTTTIPSFNTENGFITTQAPILTNSPQPYLISAPVGPNQVSIPLDATASHSNSVNKTSTSKESASQRFNSFIKKWGSIATAILISVLVILPLLTYPRRKKLGAEKLAADSKLEVVKAKTIKKTTKKKTPAKNSELKSVLISSKSLSKQ